MEKIGKMEKIGIIIFGFVAVVVLVFFNAWCYATSWNMVMPSLYGVPTITMLQAYVAVFAIAMVTMNRTPETGEEENVLLKNIIFDVFKSVVVLIFAFVIKGLFL